MLGSVAWKALLAVGLIASNVAAYPSTDPELSLAERGLVEDIKSSSVCETTPGVKQYSGYIEVGQNMSMFFWLFEARQNAATAPWVAWMNGGPGCSSMIGAFQEHGPCKFFDPNGSVPTNNSYSWNNNVNMLYIDQPINTGFSTGSPNFNSTFTAAPYVYTFLQKFVQTFPKYANRPLGVFGESYGGHWIYYAEYIARQNDLIASGQLSAQHLNLQWVGLNNAWYDPTIQMKAHVDYSYLNGYLPIINESLHTHFLKKWDLHCKTPTKWCQGETGNDTQCIQAGNDCYDYVEAPLIAQKTYDVYDVREPVATNPPETYVGYLSRPDIQKQIGAKVNYTECAEGDQSPGYRMQLTGDGSRTMLPYLNSFVNRGIPTLIWAGDTDWICDWMGSLAVVNVLNFTGHHQFRQANLTSYNFQGKSVGTYKKQGNLAFMRVFEAGHEIAVYQPEVALHVFEQFLGTGTIASS